MNEAPSLDAISTRLPPVSEFDLRPWAQSFGSDYYGALQVAAEYCGLRAVPARFPFCWQHGTWPPWQKIRAEVLVYNVPKSTRCFVARQDEVAFLKAGGYPRVRAIGLPIIYTKPSGLERIPNSLLVMPTHSIHSDVLVPSNEQYVREIASIKSRFGLVAACVSAHSTAATDLWTSQFTEQGIHVIRGAGLDDVNALKRMRGLFDSFEYVTTDSYGSHVYYAMYFGAKVSLWGTATPMLRENVLSDGAWTPYPDAVDKLFSEEAEREAEAYLGPLRVDPWIGAQNVDVANSIVGHDSKLSPDEMRAAFDWTPVRILVGSAKDIVGSARESVGSARDSVRRSRFWRAGSAAKRRLLATVKGIVG
ncbi:MAG: hypothetical protein WA581_11160 [Candidatus Acidiferrales bacterium]